jgi:hypothetical protein
VGDDAYAGQPVVQEAARYGMAVQNAAQPTDSPGCWAT